MAVKTLPPYTSNRDNYILVNDVESFVAQVLANPPESMAVDTETYYDPELVAPEAICKWIRGNKNNKPFGVSLFWGSEGYWIDHDLIKLKPLLEHDGIEKIPHNSKYDIQMLRNIGIRLGGRIWDTMLMIHLIDEEMECKTPAGEMVKSKKLKDLAYHFLGDDAHEYEDLVHEYRKTIASNSGRGINDVSYKEVSDANPELMKDYAVADTEFTYKLFPEFLLRLKAQDLMRAYENDIRATAVVVEIERTGFRVDVDLMRRYEADLDIVIRRRGETILSTVGYTFNIASDQELVAAFESMGVHWNWYTTKGEYRTDKKIIARLAESDLEDVAKVAAAVLDWRKAEKMLSTYITGLFDYIQEDGKIHCDFWVSPDDSGYGSTVTGRMSSSNPNFQNIPKKPFTIDEFEFNIRNIFIADEGYTLVFMDADQQEYRLLGHYGQDAPFMEFIHAGKDIHKSTAALMFNVPYEEVTDEQRASGKTTNFGLVYGLGNPAFAKALGKRIDEDRVRAGTRVLYQRFRPWKLPPYDTTSTPIERALDGVEDDAVKDGITYFYSDEAQSALSHAIGIKKSYFAQFPGIKQFITDCTKAGERRGFIKTWTGRRRHFKDKQFAYKGPNACIQGGCGDIMKDRLPHLQRVLEGKRSCIVNLVHDEGAFMIHNDEMDLIPVLNEILADLPFRVPISWGIETGQRWGDKTEYEEDIDEEEVM